MKNVIGSPNNHDLLLDTTVAETPSPINGTNNNNNNKTSPDSIHVTRLDPSPMASPTKGSGAC